MILLLATAASACDCEPPPVGQAVAAAGSVVEASVAEAGEIGPGGRQPLVLAVTRTALGDPQPARLAVDFLHCNSAPLGADPASWIWFLAAEPDGWSAHFCSLRLPATPEHAAEVFSVGLRERLRPVGDQVRACFRAPQGPVSPSLTIAADGRVEAVDLGCPGCSPEVVECATRALQSARLPAPPEGKVVISWP